MSCTALALQRAVRGGCQTTRLGSDAMAYEALYRRYRPSQFVDVAGQSHVVSALRNAVEADRVGHAYLFSGPRGTGKTSSARILAKALNCTNLTGGEPCDECEACQAFLAGGSYDLHELDAASNNGVEAMRDLIAKVALGSPGRTKVYILDEVHMLSAGAENALLKTLEEPPPHVVFVLCTTEPNKVVPTIRSRTQHLEFSLLTAAEIGGLIDYVIDDAGIEIDDDDRAYVIRSGGGSARDTLSALDQVISAGGAPPRWRVSRRPVPGTDRSRLSCGSGRDRRGVAVRTRRCRGCHLDARGSTRRVSCHDASRRLSSSRSRTHQGRASSVVDTSCPGHSRNRGDRNIGDRNAPSARSAN